jgi:hypothetical protein
MRACSTGRKNPGDTQSCANRVPVGTWPPVYNTTNYLMSQYDGKVRGRSTSFDFIQLSVANAASGYLQ